VYTLLLLLLLFFNILGTLNAEVKKPILKTSEWLEVRIIANKTVVQKNGVETLHGNRNALEKKKTFYIIFIITQLVT